jgi:hypothetical protein
MDPRLSTIQNVARALDLELMLVPHHLITAVDSLRRSSTGASSNRPMYALDDDDDDLEGGAESRVQHEVGPDPGNATARQQRPPQGRR